MSRYRMPWSWRVSISNARVSASVCSSSWPIAIEIAGPAPDFGDGADAPFYANPGPRGALTAPFNGPGAPVSMPIDWDELDDPGLRPDRWTIRDAVDRVRDGGDRFAGLRGDRQRLPPLG